MEEKRVTLKSRRLDPFCWIAAALLFLGGVVLSCYFQEYSGSVKFALWLVLSGAVVGLIAATSQGKRFIKFFNSARLELLKVVWPTREETFKVTGVVALLVVLTSVVLWLLDTMLLLLFRFFTR